MALPSLFLLILSLFFPAAVSLRAASFPMPVRGQLLYLLHQGEVTKGFEVYLNYAIQQSEHDFSLLQEAGRELLETGIRSSDPESQLMTLFGAAVARSSELTSLFKKGMASHVCQIQLVALSSLAEMADEASDLLLIEALASPFLLTRLEALLILAKRNHPDAINYIDSLMVKLPDPLRPLMAQVVIHLHGERAFRYMRQFLADHDLEVRLEAISVIAEMQRDEFLPTLQLLAQSSHYAEQESCALALAALKDQTALPRVCALSDSPHETVRLAALIARHELGDGEALAQIEAEAKEHSLYAIQALGRLGSSSSLLMGLLKAEVREVRLNALLALLELGAFEVETSFENYWPLLDEILIPDERDLGFYLQRSPGRGLSAWKVLASSSARGPTMASLTASTAALRESVLIACLEWQEPLFLRLAQRLFDKEVRSCIPLLIELLTNKNSPAVVACLKEGHQRTGAPLIRNYCTLALYKLQEEGNYAEELVAWVKEQGGEDLIQFREEEFETRSSYSVHPSYALQPQEAAKFLLQTLEALAATHSRVGIEALIHAMAYGNPKNRYALAGLLMRSTE